MVGDATKRPGRLLSIVLGAVVGAAVGLVTNLLTQGFTWPLALALVGLIATSAGLEYRRTRATPPSESDSPTVLERAKAGGRIHNVTTRLKDHSPQTSVERTASWRGRIGRSRIAVRGRARVGQEAKGGTIEDSDIEIS
jgi:hypothetical protein